MPESSNYLFMRKCNYKIGALIFLLLAFNLILNQMISYEGYGLLNSDGSMLTVDEFRKMNNWKYIFKIPISGLVLGALLSFIPFKHLRYQEKYLRFSLFAILAFMIWSFATNLSLMLM